MASPVFESFLKSGELSDILVRVIDGKNVKEYKLHKLILYSFSKYFARSRPANEVTLNMKHADFDVVVQWFYSEKCISDLIHKKPTGRELRRLYEATVFLESLQWSHTFLSAFEETISTDTLLKYISQLPGRLSSSNLSISISYDSMMYALKLATNIDIFANIMISLSPESVIPFALYWGAVHPNQKMDEDILLIPGRRDSLRFMAGHAEKYPQNLLSYCSVPSLQWLFVRFFQFKLTNSRSSSAASLMSQQHFIEEYAKPFQFPGEEVSEESEVEVEEEPAPPPLPMPEEESDHDEDSSHSPKPRRPVKGKAPRRESDSEREASRTSGSEGSDYHKERTWRVESKGKKAYAKGKKPKKPVDSDDE